MTVSIEQKQQIVANINWAVEYPNKPETYWHHIMSNPSADHTFAKMEQIKQTIFNLYKQYNFDTQAGQNAWTPLHVAVLKDYRDGISFLLEQNISLEIQDKYGRVATDYADELLRKFMQSKAKAHTAQQILDVSLSEINITHTSDEVSAENFPYSISISSSEWQKLREFMTTNQIHLLAKDKILKTLYEQRPSTIALKKDFINCKKELEAAKRKLKRKCNTVSKIASPNSSIELFQLEMQLTDIEKKIEIEGEKINYEEIVKKQQPDLITEISEDIKNLQLLIETQAWSKENFEQFEIVFYRRLVKFNEIYIEWNDLSSEDYIQDEIEPKLNSLSDSLYLESEQSKKIDAYRNAMLLSFNFLQKITNRYFLELLKRGKINGSKTFGTIHLGKKIDLQHQKELKKDSKKTNNLIKQYSQISTEGLPIELDFSELWKAKTRGFCYYREPSGYVIIPITKYEKYPVMHNFNYGHSLYNIHPTIKRSVVFEGTQLVEQSGLFIELHKMGGLKICIYNGLFAEQKAFSSVQNLESSISDYWHEFIKQQLQAMPRAKDHNRTMFLPIPVSQQEKNEVLLCLLEELHQEISNAPDKHARAELQDTIDFIEEEFDVSLEEATLELQAICLSEYAQSIQNEQQQVTQRVIEQAQVEESNIPVVKAKRSKSQKKVASKNKAAEVESAATEESPHKTIAKIKQNGRVKWRNTIKLLNTILKSEAGLRQKQRGSHITISSDKGATTLVKPHKKDCTSSYKGLLSFVDKLSNLLNP